MLSILLIVFIGREFYKLAEKYNKNKWLFAILGIVAFYIGTFFLGIVLGIADELFSLGLNFDNTFGLGLIALPFGIGAAYVFYIILKPNWKEEYERNLIREQNKMKAIDVYSEEE